MLTLGVSTPFTIRRVLILVLDASTWEAGDPRLARMNRAFRSLACARAGLWALFAAGMAIDWWKISPGPAGWVGVGAVYFMILVLPAIELGTAWSLFLSSLGDGADQVRIPGSRWKTTAILVTFFLLSIPWFGVVAGPPVIGLLGSEIAKTEVEGRRVTYRSTYGLAWILWEGSNLWWSGFCLGFGAVRLHVVLRRLLESAEIQREGGSARARSAPISESRKGNVRPPGATPRKEPGRPQLESPACRPSQNPGYPLSIVDSWSESREGE